MPAKRSTKPTKPNLSDLSYDELSAMQADIETRLQGLKAQKIQEMRDKILSMLADANLTLEETLGIKRLPKTVRKTVQPAYRHPDKPELTASLRGRKPKWFRELIESGVKPEDLLINKD